MRAKLLSNHVGARRMAFGSRNLKWDQFNFFEKLANSLIRVIHGQSSCKSRTCSPLVLIAFVLIYFPASSSGEASTSWNWFPQRWLLGEGLPEREWYQSSRHV